MQTLKTLLVEAITLSEGLAIPLRAFFVAALGIFLAWLWFNSLLWVAILLSLGILILGVVLYWFGKRQFPDKPVLGLTLIEFFVISPAMLAAIASGIIIVVTVNLTAPKDAPTETKEMMTALSTAITAFLTSGFISWAGDRDDSSLAKRVREIFQSKYKRFEPNEKPEEGVKYFRAESVGERLVYSYQYRGIEGWGGKARKKRARGIAQELKTGNSDPHVSPADQ